MKTLMVFFLFTNLLQAEFIKTDDTAISFGLGSAGVSYIRGASSAMINPASTCYKKAFNITLSEYFGPESIYTTYLSFVKGLNNLGTLGFILKGLYSADTIRVIDENGIFSGDFVGFSNYLLGINFSHYLIKGAGGKIYGGINIKYESEKLWDYISYGVVGDFGILYKSDMVRDLKIGFSYLNTGKILKQFIEKGNEYSREIRLGVSFSDNIFLNRLKEKRNLFFILDLILSKNGDYLAMGIENRIKRILLIRAGYRLRIGDGFQDVDFLRNLRMGIGIKLKRMRIDYSFSPKTNQSNQFLSIINISIMI